MIKRILAIIGALVLTLGFVAACGGSNPNRLDFVVYGSEEEIAVYSDMTDAFNESYGKEHNITVKLTSKPVTSYASYLQTTASAKTGPDVMLIVEDNFKGYAGSGMIGDITAELGAVENIVWDDIYPTMVNRWRYDSATNTSDPSDPIYGLPIDTKPTALYYNETFFRNAGILVVSVDEEDLDAFWAGEKTDRRGKSKSDYIAEYRKMADDKIVTSVAVDAFSNMSKLPAKGYYRSIRPYRDGESWQAPITAHEESRYKVDEVLVFNNRIAMNWDEVEDVAMIFSASSNPGSTGTASKFGSEYGYFTEWWFNYGWSVGGDCLTDLTGSGEWNFSLLDPNPNYIVVNGTFTGRTGRVYNEGETLSYLDKMAVGEGETPIPDAYGNYVHDNSAVVKNSAGQVTGGDYIGVWSEVTNEVAKPESALYELPSTRTAFERYLRLGAKKNVDVGTAKGLNIAPSPNLFNQRTAINYFFSGDLAMLVNYSIYMTEISEYMSSYNYAWDVAPLVRYKEYTDPTDPDCDEVKVLGVEAGHSNSTAMVVRKRSQKKENAAKFIVWMASSAGQSLRTSKGFFPNQVTLLGNVTVPGAPSTINKEVFGEALQFQEAGDWWYMPDYEWINVWAVPLNTYVRNNEMKYSDWYSKYVTDTNNKLKEY